MWPDSACNDTRAVPPDPGDVVTSAMTTEWSWSWSLNSTCWRRSCSVRRDASIGGVWAEQITGQLFASDITGNADSRRVPANADSVPSHEQHDKHNDGDENNRSESDEHDDSF